MLPATPDVLFDPDLRLRFDGGLLAAAYYLSRMLDFEMLLMRILSEEFYIFADISSAAMMF